jgi:hypothetical protein
MEKKLNDDIIIYICQYLDIKSILRLREVDTSVNEIICHNLYGILKYKTLNEIKKTKLSVIIVRKYKVDRIFDRYHLNVLLNCLDGSDSLSLWALSLINKNYSYKDALVASINRIVKCKTKDYFHEMVKNKRFRNITWLTDIITAAVRLDRIDIISQIWRYVHYRIKNYNIGDNEVEKIRQIDNLLRIYYVIL